MRVISDIHGLERVAPAGVTVVTCTEQACPQRWKRNLQLLKAALKSDFLVIHFSLPEVLFFTVLLFVIPLQRCRVVTLDFFVVAPKWYLQGLVRWSLRRVDRMLVYFYDSKRFQELYRLPAEKFQYIPFKVNSWEKVQVASISDEGYIFVGGRSRRDFRTLFEAVRDLPYPVKVLTAHEPDLTPHGSSLAGLTPPPNVEILYDDSDAGVFVNLMARSRMVVLPIVKSPIQAGIGVYLLGMALRKCVIISEALGVSDVLLDNQACIVAPGDVRMLRDAIERLWNDTPAREQYAEKGYRYATPLGGEDHLRASIIRAILPAGTLS